MERKWGMEKEIIRFSQPANESKVDKAEKEIMEAYNSGVNYYDTAYLYPGNEAALGEVLERTGIRDKINIATKLPHYMIKSLDNINKCFNEELKRLRTDHIDYYLMHMLTDIKSWERLVDMGIVKWLEKKKKEGKENKLSFKKK